MTDQVFGDGSADSGYGIRLRFRTSKGFTTTDSTIGFVVDGREVILTSPDSKPLQKGGWYVLKATGFVDLDVAEAFGKRLGVALQIASIRRMLGVDVGCNRATASLGKVIYDQLAEQGEFVRPNVHGLDVFKDRPGTKWFNASLKGTVSTNPTMVLEDIAAVVRSVGTETPSKFDAVRLLNEALVSVEAPAQLTLAIAAVEMLAQGEKWSAAQKRAIAGLAKSLDDELTLSDQERLEITEAVRRIYRVGVLEGFRRLLGRLDLTDLWPRWRDLYRDRSKILHGLTYATPEEHVGMVAPALLFSGRIVLTALDADISGVATNLDSVMHLPPIYNGFGS